MSIDHTTMISTEDLQGLFVEKLMDLLKKEPERTRLIQLLLNDPNNLVFIFEFNNIKKPTLGNFIFTYLYSEFLPVFTDIISKRGFMVTFPDTFDYYSELYDNYVLLYNNNVDKCVINTLVSLFQQNKLPLYLQDLI